MGRKFIFTYICQKSFRLNIVLSTEVLTKKYGSLTAVNQLKLNIPKQTIFGLLGPNGSGKTTTLGMLLGIIHPTSGDFSWFNNGSKDENRKRIGAILEHPIFYPYLSGEKNLKIAAAIKGVDENDIERVLHIVDLFDRRKDEAKKYSLGMKQRLSIGAALLGDPEVLVLDEPTNGLDPQGIAEVRSLIEKVAHTGKTIILASHLLDEVEKVCSHVAVIKNGNLLAEGSVSEIIKGEKQIEIAAENLDILTSALSGFNGIKKIDIQRDLILLTVSDEISTAQLNKYLYEQQIIINHLSLRKKRLEEQFLEMTS